MHQDTCGSEPSELRVLGLDPGSRYTGWGCVAVSGSRSRLLGCGRIVLDGATELPQRLATLQLEVAAVVERFAPRVAVLEEPFHGVNSRSLIVLAQARGALLAALALRAVEITELTPAEVKSAITGNGRADKQQVARMVTMLLPGARDLAADTSDALAVALGYASRRPLLQAAQRAAALAR